MVNFNFELVNRAEEIYIECSRECRDWNHAIAIAAVALGSHFAAECIQIREIPAGAVKIQVFRLPDR